MEASTGYLLHRYPRIPPFAFHPPRRFLMILAIFHFASGEHLRTDRINSFIEFAKYFINFRRTEHENVGVFDRLRSLLEKNVYSQAISNFAFLDEEME